MRMVAGTHAAAGSAPSSGRRWRSIPRSMRSSWQEHALAPSHSGLACQRKTPPRRPTRPVPAAVRSAAPADPVPRHDRARAICREPKPARVCLAAAIFRRRVGSYRLTMGALEPGGDAHDPRRARRRRQVVGDGIPARRAHDPAPAAATIAAATPRSAPGVCAIRLKQLARDTPPRRKPWLPAMAIPVQPPDSRALTDSL